MPMYQLRRKFFDGAVMHQPLEVVEFEEGTAPSSAVLYEEPAEKKGGGKAAPSTLSELQADEPTADEAKKGDSLSTLGKKK